MSKTEIKHKITGKGRPRFYGGHAVTPPKTREYETLVKECYIGKLHEGAVRVNIDVFCGIPKSYSKKLRNEILNTHIKPQKKPDIDNIAKIILDGLNGVAYKDDTQVVDLHITKHYHDGEDLVKVEVIEV